MPTRDGAAVGTSRAITTAAGGPGRRPPGHPPRNHCAYGTNVSRPRRAGGAASRIAAVDRGQERVPAGRARPSRAVEDQNDPRTTAAGASPPVQARASGPEEDETVEGRIPVRRREAVVEGTGQRLRGMGR